MRVRLIPGTVAIAALAGGALVVLLALAIGASLSGSVIIGAAWIGVLSVAAALDYFMTRRDWRAAEPQLVAATGAGARRQTARAPDNHAGRRQELAMPAL